MKVTPIPGLTPVKQVLILLFCLQSSTLHLVLLVNLLQLHGSKNFNM